MPSIIALLPAVAAPAASTAAAASTATAVAGAGAAAGASATSLASIAALTGSLGFGYKQYQAGKEAANLQQAMESRKAQRSQLQALREAQIKRAMMIQAGANSGVMDSSGFQGGIGSLQSQLAGNIGFANQMTSFGQVIGSAQQQMNRFGALANISGTLGDFAQSETGQNLFG